MRKTALVRAHSFIGCSSLKGQSRTGSVDVRRQGSSSMHSLLPALARTKEPFWSNRSPGSGRRVRSECWWLMVDVMVDTTQGDASLAWPRSVVSVVHARLSRGRTLVSVIVYVDRLDMTGGCGDCHIVSRPLQGGHARTQTCRGYTGS